MCVTLLLYQYYNIVLNFELIVEFCFYSNLTSATQIILSDRVCQIYHYNIK